MTNAEWSSNSASAGSLDTVVVNPPLTEQHYTVGVYGVSDSEFSLVASVVENAIWLINGQPQRHFVQFQKMEYFIFAPHHPTCSLTLSVVALNGDPDVFISMQALPQCTELNQ